jgi:hypothetical protein
LSRGVTHCLLTRYLIQGYCPDCCWLEGGVMFFIRMYVTMFP